MISFLWDIVSYPLPLPPPTTHTHTHNFFVQVVLRTDVAEDFSSASSHLDPSSPRPGDVHLAHTNYKVVCVSSQAPQRSCLILIHPITGDDKLSSLNDGFCHTYLHVFNTS